jgi:DNA-binding Lrp family transcriptional regulator
LATICPLFSRGGRGLSPGPDSSLTNSISGQYDLLMKLYLSETTDIGHFVTEHLQKLSGVKDTFTIIAFKAFSENSSL